MSWAEIAKRDFEPVNDTPPGFEVVQVIKRVFCSFGHAKKVEDILTKYGTSFEKRKTKVRACFMAKLSMNERVQICRLLREEQLWMRIRGQDIGILSL